MTSFEWCIFIVFIVYEIKYLFILFWLIVFIGVNKENSSKEEFGPYVDSWMIEACGVCEEKHFYIKKAFVYHVGTKAPDGEYFGLPNGHYCLKCLREWLEKDKKENPAIREGVLG